MSVINSLEYKRSRARAEKLHELLLQLDSAAEILYNNIQYEDVFGLILKLEDIRFKYYNEYEIHSNVLEFKGTTDV